MANMRPRQQQMMATQRATIQRVNEVSAQETWLMGRILVEGVGETTVDITFPVSFGERPLPILGGGEYLNDHQPEWTQFPTCQAVVVKWHTKTQSGGVGQPDYYVGATLAVTVFGPPDQRIEMSFAFVGSALTNMAMEG